MNVTISFLISKTLSNSPIFTQKSLTLKNSALYYKPFTVFYNIKKLKIDSSYFKNSFGPIILNEVSYSDRVFDSQVSSQSGETTISNCGFYNINTKNNGCAISCSNNDLSIQTTYFVSCYTSGVGVIHISSSTSLDIRSSKAEDCYGKTSNLLYSDSTTQNTVYQLLMINCASPSSPNTDFCVHISSGDLTFQYVNSTICNSFGDGAVCSLNTKNEFTIDHNIAYSSSGKNLYLISSQIDSILLNNLIFISCSAQQGIITTKSQSTISQSIFYNTKGLQGFPIFSTLTFTKCYFNTQLVNHQNVIFDDCVYTISNMTELLKDATENYVYPKIGTNPANHNYIDDELPPRTPERTKDTSYQFNTSGIMIMIIWFFAIVLILMILIYWLMTRNAHVTVVEELHKEIQKEHSEQKDKEIKEETPLLDDQNQIDVDQNPKPIWVQE